MEERERRKGYETEEKKGKKKAVQKGNRGLSKRVKEGCKLTKKGPQTNKKRAAN